MEKHPVELDYHGPICPLAASSGRGNHEAFRAPVSRVAIAALVCAAACLLLLAPLRAMTPGIFLAPVPLGVLALAAGGLLIPVALLLSCIALWRIARSGGELRGFWISLASLGAGVIGCVVLRSTFAALAAFHL